MWELKENGKNYTIDFLIAMKAHSYICGMRKCDLCCRLLTGETWSTKGASHHPAFMISYLTISQTRLSGPPCAMMGFDCGSGNEETVRTEFYPKLAAQLKHRFDVVEMPNLFCVAGMEWACVNGGGGHEVMCR